MSDTPRIEDVPPSAKLVYKVLEYNGALTQQGIVERSMLSPRTVRDAIRRLREVDAVAEEVYIPDARQNLYRLTAGEETGETADAADVEAAGSD